MGMLLRKWREREQAKAETPCVEALPLESVAQVSAPPPEQVETPAPVSEQPKPEQPETDNLDVLRAKAKSLGVKYTGSMGEETLMAKIAEREQTEA